MKSLPCALCDAAMSVPDGTDSEYGLVLGGPNRCHVVCDDCSGRALARVDGIATSPRGVRAALADRFGGGAAAWASPNSLPGLLQDARKYLSSREAREGLDFGTWQKMVDLGALR